MKKIPTLFKRNEGSGPRHVYDEATPGTEWVFAGEGVATRKFDGTCCRVHGGKLWKRHTIKYTPQHPQPPLDYPAEFVNDGDQAAGSGKCEGWMPVGDGPEAQWHREAWEYPSEFFLDGTYELVGPKVQGNPEGFAAHRLVPHGAEELAGVHPDFESLRAYLTEHDIEGIVWHHPDGRMAKIKGKDFGIKRIEKACAPPS